MKWRRAAIALLRVGASETRQNKRRRGWEEHAAPEHQWRSNIRTLPHAGDAPKSNSAPGLERAVEFLTAVAAGGRIAVAFIAPDSAPIGATFDTAAEGGSLRAFLQDHNGRANLYYTLNEPKPIADQVGERGKLREEDVSRIRGVVVDLDPDRAAETTDGGYDRERGRLLGLAEKWRHNFFAAPTAVVDSGNGVQMVWLFSELLPNDAATRSRVKAQAKGLGNLLGSDKVQSVDHLFRIPFTDNIPNAKKLAKGRTRTSARLLHFEGSNAYTLESLSMLAAPAQAVARVSTAATELDYAKILAAAAGDPLPAHLVSTREALVPLVRSMSGGSDRSERDFAVAARCVELGLTDPSEVAQVVFSSFPDKLLEKDDFGRGEDYAARTVAAALSRAKPQPNTRAEAWFAGAPAAPAKVDRPRLALRVVSGLVNPSTIRVREWLVQPRLPIGDVTQCVGEPGISKSTFVLRDALIVATGREDLLRGADARNEPISPERLHASGAVIVYNAEDRLEEMERRLAAAQRHYGLCDADMKHSIILWSGVDHGPLKIMERRHGDRGALTRAAGADRLEQAITEHSALLVVLDPQISLVAGGQENDNDDQDALMQELAVMAFRCGANITVIHHTSKTTRGAAGDMGAGRGGFAAVGKVRSAYTLTNVTGAGAGESAWGATANEQLIRLDYSKVSHDRKPREPLVFRRVSAPVGNSSGETAASAAGQFAGSPREQLRASGDYAPVLELVDIGARLKAGEGKASEKSLATAARVAAVADAVLGDRDEADLSDVWMAIGDGLRAAGLSKGKTIRAVSPFVLGALERGQTIERGGQSVRLQAVKTGGGRTAPWRIRRDLLGSAKEAA